MSFLFCDVATAVFTAPTNEEHCCGNKYFPVCLRPKETFVAGGKMFLNLFNVYAPRKLCLRAPLLYLITAASLQKRDFFTTRSSSTRTP